MMEDYASMLEWFHDNEDIWIKPYIESNFSEASYDYQYNFMKEHLFFTKKIIQDAMMGSDEKMLRFLKLISFGKSKIITIIGGRGSGKTAFVMFIVEKLYEEGYHKSIYYVKKGDRPEWLPEWINSAQAMEEVPNKSFAILDETVLEYGARNFASDENKSFTERLVILRHKDTSVVLITQHSKLVDINISRLSDILIYKNRANVEDQSKADEEKQLILKRLMPRDQQHALLEIKQYNAFWVIETGLASFWDDELVSKTYKDYNPEKHKRDQRTKRYQQELAQLSEKEKIRVEARTARSVMDATKKVNKEVINPEDLLDD